MSWKFQPIRLPILSALATAASVSVCHAELVAHYKFDETTGATAVNSVAANGGNGVIGSNVGIGVAGKIGSAVQLKNDQNDVGVVDMGNATGIFNKITASGKLTLSYWLNSTDIAANRSVAVFMGNDMDSNDYIDSGILGGAQANPPAPNGSAYGRNRKNTDAQIGDMFGTLINDGNFHHLALTIDTAATTASFYVDSALVDTEVSALKFAGFPTFNNFEIGRLGRQAKADPIAGLVDDLQVYSEALSHRQIAAIFNNPGQTLNDLPPVLDGDTDGNGLIDVADFNNIRNSLGYAGLTPGLGVDIAGSDGVIDFRDLRFFQQSYPTVAAAALAADAVPEPASLALGAFAIVAAAGVSRRCR